MSRLYALARTLAGQHDPWTARRLFCSALTSERHAPARKNFGLIKIVGATQHSAASRQKGGGALDQYQPFVLLVNCN